MQKPETRIAIVGAGITGLTVAQQLKREGADVEIFEKNGFAGGSVKSVQNNGWLLEYGPNTLLLKDQGVSSLISNIGLEEEKIKANEEASKRYIVKNRELIHLPVSLLNAVTNPLFSFQAKLRVLGEPFVSKSNDQDQTVAEFVRKRLGLEMLDYALNPFIAGIYANRPEKLSLRHAFPAMHTMEQEYGSLILGAVLGAGKRRKAGRIPRELISFRKGLQELCNELAEQVNKIHYNHRVQQVTGSKNRWILETKRGEYGPFEKVVINIPVYLWKDDLIPDSKDELEILRGIDYPPLSVFHLGFKTEQVRHPLDGFGFLVPEKEDMNILGALFSSTLFPNRAPSGHDLLTVFVGGGRQPELAKKESSELLNLVMGDLRTLIGVEGAPVMKEHVFWPHSIPGYHVGYDDILDALNRLEQKNPGLYFAGNFRNGISVPDCIKNGIELAGQLLRS